MRDVSPSLLDRCPRTWITYQARASRYALPVARPAAPIVPAAKHRSGGPIALMGCATGRYLGTSAPKQR